ncbi:uncharacterized protein LOC141659697 [Apium graveolens]|uniref:uncharacterized protein LOC141659697 n=1 Tax=Apium graveolens TaxID=4045 RepID=UPI003D7A1BCD
MLNCTKLVVNALDVTGKNYLTWILDAKIHLSAMGLGKTIKEGNKTSEPEKNQNLLKIKYLVMLEKSYSTFYANNMLLQQQYSEKEFQKYSELISVLLFAEQNNELLMKNHQVRPTGSTPFPGVNVVTSNDLGPSKQFGRG